MFIFSNFTMFVKQILKDSPINLKNCNSSYFLSCSPVREFMNSLWVKWDYPVCLGSRIARKVSKQLPITMYRYEAQISDSNRKKKKQTHRTWKKLENLLPVDSFLLELIVVSNIGHVSLTTAFSSFLLILCSCFNKFLFTINWFLLLNWFIMNIKYWLTISSSKNYLVLLGVLTSCI